MKILLTLLFLNYAATLSASDKTEIVEAFSRASRSISLYLADRTSFQNVEIIKSTGENWIQIRYTPIMAPQPPLPWETMKSPKPLLCWVNVDHIVRIVQNKKEDKSSSSD